MSEKVNAVFYKDSLGSEQLVSLHRTNQGAQKSTVSSMKAKVETFKSAFNEVFMVDFGRALQQDRLEDAIMMYNKYTTDKALPNTYSIQQINVSE